MTIDELHDYCRYLFDKNHVHGVPDKWKRGLRVRAQPCHAQVP